MSFTMSTATVVVLGAAEVGKTTLVKAYTGDARPISKIGGNVYQIVQHTENDECNYIDIVDTDNSALGKLFKRGNRHHMKHGDAFVIVYSMNDAQSYYAAMETCLEVYKYQGFRDVPVVLVGNKADLKCQVSEYRLPYLKDLSRQYCIAKMDNNVQTVFAQVITAVLSGKRNRARRQRMGLRLNSIGSEDDRHQTRPSCSNYSRLQAAMMEGTELAVSPSDSERQSEARRELNMVWVNSTGLEDERSEKGRAVGRRKHRYLSAEIMHCAVLETVDEESFDCMS